jgi:hydrogenase maturation protease
MKKTLILGYGNADRQDDGVAWHVLARLANRMGRSAPLDVGEGFESEEEGSPEFLYALQLTPEMAEMIARFERICFVDAHTGSLPEDLQIIPLQASFQNSPFTHHLTPETLLSFAKTIYTSQPSAKLLSIRGYEFGFAQDLSPGTNALADQAVDYLLQWLQSP